MILLSCACPSPSPNVMVVTATPNPSPPGGAEPPTSPPTAVPTATSLPQAKIVTTAIVPTATSLPQAVIVTTVVVPTTFRLINRSARPICWFYLTEYYGDRSPWAMGWGEARIEPANPLRPGQERTFEFKPGAYNLQVKDCNNQLMDEQYEIAIAGEEFRWVISH